MCQGLLGEEYFLTLTKKFKKRIVRSRTNTRSYRRNIKQVKFLARNASVFGRVFEFDEKNRDFTVRAIKQEEIESDSDDDDDEDESECPFERLGIQVPDLPKGPGVAWPIQYFKKGAYMGERPKRASKKHFVGGGAA
jgi:hypothetical protein